MTEPNIPLLRKAVEWAEAEAAKGFAYSEWYQQDYITPPERARVGAFWAHDDEFYRDAPVVEDSTDPQQQVYVKDADCGTCYCIAGKVASDTVPEGSILLNSRMDFKLPDGSMVDVEDYATKQLGLSDEQACRLFAGGNTIEDVRRVAEQIAGEKL